VSFFTLLTARLTGYGFMSASSYHKAVGSPMTVRYRQILESDVAAITRIHRRACLIAYKFMDWSHTEDEVREWYAGKFWEWDWGLVAEDITVVGFVATMGAHLDQLFVDPDCQGLGIGTSLLTAALKKAPPVATLMVFEEASPARRLYEKRGFREVRRFRNERERAMELVYSRRVSS
jgi:putative acetyltransferase